MIEQNKSDLEKVLAGIPSAQEMWKKNFNSNRIYSQIRLIEKAYEQLAAAGTQCQDQLKERRYQIIDLAINMLDVDLSQLGIRLIRDADSTGMIQISRIKDKDYFDVYIGSLHTSIDKIAEYLRKVAPESNIDMDRSTIYED